MDADEGRLWACWRGGRDARARELLLGLHLPYARIVAATFYARRRHDEIAFDDYLQHARVGLLEAFDRFDPERGVLFRTFAGRRMQGAILDGIERATEKQQQVAVRVRLHREPGGTEEVALLRHLADAGLGTAVCRLLEGTGMADPADAAAERTDEGRHERALEQRQLRTRMHALVAALPEQQRAVIRAHYLQEQSFESLSERLRLTRGRISQIHRAGLGALRALMDASPRSEVAW